MSREILFRGKRIDNNEWVDGSFCQGYDNLDGLVSAIVTMNKNKPSDQKICDVDPKTVSQKLTLIDKNGNTFFDGWEGDRIRAYSICNKHPFEEYNNTEKYTEGVIKWSVNCFALVTDDNLVIDGWINAEKVEVIGNIHDDIGEVE